MRFFEYLKVAFLNRWNLLLFGGALGFSLLSGRADVWMPLVLAGEIGFLGLLSAHPKFQAYVDAQRAKALRGQTGTSPDRALQAILRSLPDDAIARFEALRGRCLELRQIARSLKDPGNVSASQVLEESQLSGLDRLLWIYLRMLFTQHSIERFLRTTSGNDIQRDIEDLEGKLKKVAGISDEIQRQKFARTIEDNLQTCRDRLANYQKARSNHELIRLEIDRLENKIRSLSELAVNRQEPDFITAQVDQVASSMIQTEQTMNELQFATGMPVVEDAAPKLLQMTEG